MGLFTIVALVLRIIILAYLISLALEVELSKETKGQLPLKGSGREEPVTARGAAVLALSLQVNSNLLF